MSKNDPEEMKPFDRSMLNQVLQRVEPVLEEGRGAVVALTGGTDQQYGLLLQAVSEQTGFSLHRFDMKQLVTERRDVTEGNLRERFDSAHEGAAILHFYGAESLFSVPDKSGRESDDTHLPADYLFDRAEAFDGITVLSFLGGEIPDRHRNRIDALLRF